MYFSDILFLFPSLCGKDDYSLCGIGPPSLLSIPPSLSALSTPQWGMLNDLQLRHLANEMERKRREEREKGKKAKESRVKKGEHKLLHCTARFPPVFKRANKNKQIKKQLWGLTAGAFLERERLACVCEGCDVFEESFRRRGENRFKSGRRGLKKKKAGKCSLSSFFLLGDFG